jgi:hypothetical protein
VDKILRGEAGRVEQTSLPSVTTPLPSYQCIRSSGEEAIRVEGDDDGILTMNRLHVPCHHYWQVAKLCGAIIFTVRGQTAYHIKPYPNMAY